MVHLLNERMTGKIDDQQLFTILGNSKAYYSWMADSNAWMLMEAVTRLRSCPFGTNSFVVLRAPDDISYAVLAYVVGFFYAGRDDDLKLVDQAQEDHDVVLVTPWRAERHFSPTIRIRGEDHPHTDMPLYIEAGDYDSPQVNPIFDWTDHQLWAFMLRKSGIV